MHKKRKDDLYKKEKDFFSCFLCSDFLFYFFKVYVIIYSDKYKRFYGLYLFIAVILALVFVGMNILPPQIEALKTAKEEVENQTTILEGKAKQKQIVQNKIKQMSDASQRTQKKIFSPIENDLGNDSLFFALYNDVIEMIHSNSIKIKKMDYDYNPDDDVFVQHGKLAVLLCTCP